MAAAITNNGIGIAGAAPGCKIMAVRAGYLTSEGQGVVRMDFVSQAMIYAAGKGADIINGSWGSSSYLANAVATCQNAGVLIVTAAGNDNTDSDAANGVPSYLSTYARVLAVAATEPSDGKASFSNYGTWVEISAPGTGIYTTAYNAGTQSSALTPRCRAPASPRPIDRGRRGAGLVGQPGLDLHPGLQPADEHGRRSSTP